MIVMHGTSVCLDLECTALANIKFVGMYPKSLAPHDRHAWHIRAFQHLTSHTMARRRQRHKLDIQHVFRSELRLLIFPGCSLYQLEHLHSQLQHEHGWICQIERVPMQLLHAQ
jgi:hypothetical protein